MIFGTSTEVLFRKVPREPSTDSGQTPLVRLSRAMARYPAAMMRAALPEVDRLLRSITGAPVRLSAGLEDVDDLRADLEQAFDAARTESRRP